MDLFNLMVSLLPIIIFVGVFIYLKRKFGEKFNLNKAYAHQKETLDVLKEIRDELKELNSKK